MEDFLQTEEIMRKEELQFQFEVYESVDELAAPDAELLTAARNVTGVDYAPYSKFNVGAVARLKTGNTVAGTNQENASYPVGLCAERALLASAAMLYTNIPIDTMAVSYHNHKAKATNLFLHVECADSILKSMKTEWAIRFALL